MTEVGKFLPEECIRNLDVYDEILKQFLCTPCQFGTSTPDYISNTYAADGTVASTTLYVCDYFAKMLYAPGQDPNTVDLSKPTTAFDSCGFKLYS